MRSTQTGSQSPSLHEFAHLRFGERTRKALRSAVVRDKERLKNRGTPTRRSRFVKEDEYEKRLATFIAGLEQIAHFYCCQIADRKERGQHKQRIVRLVNFAGACRKLSLAIERLDNEAGRFLMHLADNTDNEAGRAPPLPNEFFLGFKTVTPEICERLETFRQAALKAAKILPRHRHLTRVNTARALKHWFTGHGLKFAGGKKSLAAHCLREIFFLAGDGKKNARCDAVISAVLRESQSGSTRTSQCP
jgi:hypothetical protein